MIYLSIQGFWYFAEKKSKISRDFQGKIRGKIGRFRGILAGKKVQIRGKIGRFRGKKVKIRLFTVLYSSVRSSKSSALRYGHLKIKIPVTVSRGISHEIKIPVKVRRGISHEKIGDCEQSKFDFFAAKSADFSRPLFFSPPPPPTHVYPSNTVYPVYPYISSIPMFTLVILYTLYTPIIEVLKKYFTFSLRSLVKYFRHSKKNFISQRGHVISSIYQCIPSHENVSNPCI